MPDTVSKVKVPFLCTGNSRRSQVAEGRARHLKGDRLEPHFAGIEMRGLDSLVVMNEIRRFTQSLPEALLS